MVPRQSMYVDTRVERKGKMLWNMSETHSRLPVLQCCASWINNLIAYLLFSSLFTWMLLDCCCCLLFHFFFFSGNCLDRLAQRQKNRSRVWTETSYEAVIKKKRCTVTHGRTTTLTPAVSLLHNSLFHPSRVPPTVTFCGIFLVTLNHFMFDYYHGQKAANLRKPIDPFR